MNKFNMLFISEEKPVEELTFDECIDMVIAFDHSLKTVNPSSHEKLIADRHKRQLEKNRIEVNASEVIHYVADRKELEKRLEISRQKRQSYSPWSD